MRWHVWHVVRWFTAEKAMIAPTKITTTAAATPRSHALGSLPSRST
jgi:hypothetical protein